MNVDIGIKILMAFSVVLGVTCLFGFILPRKLVDWVAEFWEKLASLYIAVIARLILGALLIWVAPESRFPIGFSVFGYLTMVAAVLIPIIGRRKIGLLMLWLKTSPTAVMRLWLLVGFAFCWYIFYGVL